MLGAHAPREMSMSHRYLRGEQVLLLGEVRATVGHEEGEEGRHDRPEVVLGRATQPERMLERDVVIARQRGELGRTLHAVTGSWAAIHGDR